MKKNQKGFSLIELLIVVVVIGILAVITVPKVWASRSETNEASAIESLRAISRAQAIYQSTNPTRDFAQNGAVLANAGLIDNELGCAASSCIKSGYVFIIIGSNRTSTLPTSFNAVAFPQVFGTTGTGTRSFSTSESGIIYFSATASAPTYSAVTRVVSGGSPIYNVFPNKFDFEGDGKSDVATYRPSNGTWYLQTNRFGPTVFQFGSANDRIVPADYDSDGKTNFAVYRDGYWYIEYSCLCSFQSIQFGESSDIPVPADYDGDGKTDIAVFRPSNGVWYIRGSAIGFYGISFGASDDKPVAGDYDGDGKADLAVFRPSDGTWYILQSTLGFKAIQFGAADDKLVAADYDGDGKMDVAVYRPSNGIWYLNQSTAGMKAVGFGISTDVPVPSDYNGDGKADIAVFRDGTWYIQESGVEQLRSIQFGTIGDKPASNAFVY